MPNVTNTGLTLVAAVPATPPQYPLAAVFIPLAAALITGTFALVNARTHPTEKLKNLIDASKELPDRVHARSAFDRVILREVARLDMSTSPWYRRNFRLSFVTFLYTLFVVVIFQFPSVFHTNPAWSKPVSLGANIFAVIVGVTTFVAARKHARAHRQRYEPRFDAIDGMEDRELADTRAIKDAAAMGDGAAVPQAIDPHADESASDGPEVG